MYETSEDEDIAQEAPDYDAPMPLNAPQEVLSMRDHVYQFIAAHGALGVTDDEIERGLGWPGNTTRARRIELTKAGAVKRKRGAKRRTAAGRKAVIWVATQYVVRVIDDTPKEGPAAELHEARLKINRRVALMDADEVAVMAVLSDCGGLDVSELSLLQELFKLGITADHDAPTRASFYMLALVNWARANWEVLSAAIETAQNQRDELWTLLHEVSNLPDVCGKDNALLRKYALELADSRFDVDDTMTTARLDAAADRVVDRREAADAE